MNCTPFSPNDRIGRRTFVANALATAGAFTLSALPLAGNASNALSARPAHTVQDIIDLILQAGGLSPIADTVDTIKSGKGSQVVTGIVTTMFATIRVIEEAVKHKANFIIAHEPTFYNHRDDTAWVKNNTVVDLERRGLIAAAGPDLRLTNIPALEAMADGIWPDNDHGMAPKLVTAYRAA
jgi:hypothetical protein